ncbi:MAG: hypothetical protein KDB14_24660 [Planctomycetales bacterium]|nr:hypothetical protein [Planctomycetales bacterium]
MDIDPSEIQSHADAIVHLADAKAFNQPIAEGVFIRATKPNIIIQSVDTGDTIPVSQLTASTGCAAIQLSDKRSWTFQGSVAVVENADAFWLHERVIPFVDLVIFASGRMSGRLLDWFASC